MILKHILHLRAINYLFYSYYILYKCTSGIFIFNLYGLLYDFNIFI